MDRGKRGQRLVGGPDRSAPWSSAPAPRPNTATITHSDQFDPNPGNNTASTVETPQQADLVLTKTVSNPTPNVGDTITFTVTVQTTVPATATGVRCQDLLPAGVTFVSATPSQGSYNTGTGIWTVGTVDLSTAQTLVDPGDGREREPVDEHGDDQPHRPVRPQHRQQHRQRHRDAAAGRPGPAPRRSATRHPNVGDTITFTVTLTNIGPNTPRTSSRASDPTCCRPG